MLSTLERWRVQLAVKLAWRSNRRRAEAIRGFQATEADGVWHLQQGLKQLTDPKQKAIVFLHSLEEESHADEFATVYKPYAEQVLQPVQYEREPLYRETEPAWKTFAFVHVGEEDATERFRYLHDALDPCPLKDSLERIIEDESGHVGLTHSMLGKLGATGPEVRVELLKVRGKRLWEQWLRVGKRVVDNFSTVTLSLLYFVVGPFVAAAARRRLQSRVVEFDNSQLKRL